MTGVTIGGVTDEERTRLCAEANAKVAAEMERFWAALPQLLSSDLRDHWVIFLDGEVRYASRDRNEVYSLAVRELGPYAGFVMAKVEPREPKYLSPFRWPK